MSDPALQVLFSGADFSLDILTRRNPKAVVEIAFPIVVILLLAAAVWFIVTRRARRRKASQVSG